MNAPYIFTVVLILTTIKKVEGLRTTNNSCTYEYIGCYKDKPRRHAYNVLYKNMRNGELSKHYSDMSYILDVCCDSLVQHQEHQQQKNSYFGIQFYGECFTHHQGEDYRRYKMYGEKNPVKGCRLRQNSEEIEKTRYRIGRKRENGIYCSFKCGYKKPSRNRIVGGTVQEVWPWMGALFTTDQPTVIEGFRCGVSLISCQWIVTAGHCVHSNRRTIEDTKAAAQSGQLRVLFGKTDLDIPTGNEGLLIDDVIIPKQWNDNWPRKMYVPSSFDWDIALIKLKEPINIRSDVNPVCLDEEPPKLVNNETYTVIGWGSVNVSWPSQTPRTHHLMGVETELHDDLSCSDTRDVMLCFQHRGDTRKGMCNGDSGGPIMRKKEDQWYQTAVVSSSFKRFVVNKLYCSFPDLPEYGTRITHPEIRAWIKNIADV